MIQILNSLCWFTGLITLTGLCLIIAMTLLEILTSWVESWMK